MGTLNIPPPPAYLVRSPFTFNGLQFHGGQVVTQPDDWSPQHIEMLIEGNRIVGITSQITTVEADGMNFVDGDWANGYKHWKQVRADEAAAALVEDESDELSVPIGQSNEEADGEGGESETDSVSKPTKPAQRRK